MMLMLLGRTSTLCGINSLDIVTLCQSTLVGTQASLGKLVHSLICRGTARLDHIQNATFVGTQTGHFANDSTHQLGVLAQFL